MSDIELFEDAMALHARYCDRKDRPHQCVGQATIKRGEVCLDCPLCGKGDHVPLWKAWLVEHAEKILEAAGVQFHMLNREAQTAVLEALKSAKEAA